MDHTLLHSALPHHTTPYHTIPYHTIPHHTTPYHTTPHHTNLDKEKVDCRPSAVNGASRPEHCLPTFQGLLFSKNIRNHLHKLLCLLNRLILEQQKIIATGETSKATTPFHSLAIITFIISYFQILQLLHIFIIFIIFIFFIFFIFFKKNLVNISSVY